VRSVERQHKPVSRAASAPCAMVNSRPSLPVGNVCHVAGRATSGNSLMNLEQRMHATAAPQIAGGRPSEAKGWIAGRASTGKTSRSWNGNRCIDEAGDAEAGTPHQRDPSSKNFGHQIVLPSLVNMLKAIGNLQAASCDTRERCLRVRGFRWLSRNIPGSIRRSSKFQPQT